MSLKHSGRKYGPTCVPSPPGCPHVTGVRIEPPDDPSQQQAYFYLTFDDTGVNVQELYMVFRFSTTVTSIISGVRDLV